MKPSGNHGAKDFGLLARAVASWRKAQIVVLPPSLDGKPEAIALVEEVAHHPELEGSLWQLMGDANQLVVAHALIALELMGSDKLASLPEAVLSNRSSITLHLGGIRTRMDLSGFARQVRMRARVADE